MASSRRSPPADTSDAAAADRVVADALRRALRSLSNAAPDRETRIAIALSGGRDSMVLLDATSRIAPALGFVVSAVHVHHGLSANADAWAAFCADQCDRRAIPFEIRRVSVPRDRGDGVEAAARRARYDALASVGAHAVALAHHADDQAETLLLQLFRGAGAHGLAAMPASRVEARTTFIRPLLDLPRRALERYAHAHALEWIHDESNDDRARTRNLIRHSLAPGIAAAFPGYPITIARAAAHQAEAALIADDLAIEDARHALHDGTLDRDHLATLAARAPHRARNLLRWFLRESGLRPPSAARLAAMLEQLAHAARDARIRVRHDGREIGVHRGRVVVHDPPTAPYAIRWRGEMRLALPHGTLEFAPATGEGLDAAAARDGDVVVRSREGGERLRLDTRGARHTVKHLLQRADVPHWERSALPFVYCGDALAAVPGIGVDASFAAGPGSPGYALHWRPHERTANPLAYRER